MDTLPLLLAFFNQVDVLVLIMVRVSAFFILVPVISSLTIPMQVRLALAFVVTVALFSAGVVTEATYVDTPAGLIVLILNEFMAGAFMGFVVFFVFNVLLFAGHLIDFSMGFAMVNVVDPVQQIQVPVVGNIMLMSMSVLLILNGGLHEIMRVFFESYTLVPIGTAIIIDNRELAHFIVVSFVGFIMLALRFAMPIMATMLIINVCLGIMVKAVPQMNVFVVGMPLKVLVGLILIFMVMIPSFNFIYDLLFTNAFNTLVSTIEGMASWE